MPKNEAAWLVAKQTALVVSEAPYTEPKDGEILVRNHAIAVNPVDWMTPLLGSRIFPWLKRPCILGSDLAGEVVAVGPSVGEVRVGDRVLAMAVGTSRQRNRSEEGAFQNYTITLPSLTTKIPDHITYEAAAVLPVGFVTAAAGLFQKDLLALDLPKVGATPHNRWIIITGGATSVGCNAIQLAVAAGYRVVTTASPKNFDYLKSLGASYVFDYRDKGLVSAMAAALRDKDMMGALAVSAGSSAECIDVLAHCRGRKFVANCGSPVSPESFGRSKQPMAITFLKLLPSLAQTSFRIWLKARHHKITPKFYDGSSIIDSEIGRYLFQVFLKEALAKEIYRPAPPPHVVGTHLSDIQVGFEVQKQGVSASKVVIALE